MGQGRFNAPRGGRRHNGTDYLCEPNQPVRAPISGTITRIVYPYEKGGYTGCEIVGDRVDIVMFYLRLGNGMVGQYVMKGGVIGYAQDISKKYGKEMKPHIHLRITRCDPELLMSKL